MVKLIYEKNSLAWCRARHILDLSFFVVFISRFFINFFRSSFRQKLNRKSEDMNFYCDYCALTFGNEEEFGDHLRSESHLAEELKIDSDETDGSKDSEIYCVFCCKPFDSIDKVEIHVAEEHSADDEPESNDFLQQHPQIKFEADIHPHLPIEIKTESDLSNMIFFDPTETAGTLVLSDKLTVFDVDLNIVEIDATKLDQIKFCVRCNRHFDGEDNLRQHQLKDHAIRKRKRSTHPNGVEGIVVTGDGRWSCDVCGREFPTLKQAKVHKFKSHIEPIQKQEMLSYDFMARNNKESGISNGE